MQEPPQDARTRLERELANGVEGRGFRRDTKVPDVVTFKLSAPSWLNWGSPSVAVWWEFFAGQQLSFAFEPDNSGTKVNVKGRVSKPLAGALEALGRPGRWPHTDDDPDWSGGSS
jgi:hypothetical protein